MEYIRPHSLLLALHTVICVSAPLDPFPHPSNTKFTCFPGLKTSGSRPSPTPFPSLPRGGPHRAEPRIAAWLAHCECGGRSPLHDGPGCFSKASSQLHVKGMETIRALSPGGKGETQDSPAPTHSGTGSGLAVPIGRKALLQWASVKSILKAALIFKEVCQF